MFSVSLLSPLPSSLPQSQFYFILANVRAQLEIFMINIVLFYNVFLNFRFGLMLMLVASLVSGFFFTILVWLDSHTWIYIRKK